MTVLHSLGDWEMRSDRNCQDAQAQEEASLGDWEMRSDRNGLDPAAVQAIV